MKYIKVFEDFENERWMLTIEDKAKIDSEIEEVLIELVDKGFTIDIDHFARRGTGDNSILITIKRKPFFNTSEVKDYLEVLIDYMKENYDVVSTEYYNISKNFEENVNKNIMDLDIIILFNP